MKKILSTAIILYETEASWRNLLIVTIVLTLAYCVIAPSSPSSFMNASHSSSVPQASFSPSIILTPALTEELDVIHLPDTHAVKLPDPIEEAPYSSKDVRIIKE